MNAPTPKSAQIGRAKILTIAGTTNENFANLMRRNQLPWDDQATSRAWRKFTPIQAARLRNQVDLRAAGLEIETARNMAQNLNNRHCRALIERLREAGLMSAIAQGADLPARNIPEHIFLIATDKMDKQTPARRAEIEAEIARRWPYDASLPGASTAYEIHAASLPHSAPAAWLIDTDAARQYFS